MTLVVSDASPLNALQQIDELRLLQGLFGEVIIPPAVARERCGGAQAERPPRPARTAIPKKPVSIDG